VNFGKLHLLDAAESDYMRNIRFIFSCGQTSEPGGHKDFTNDVSVMESLPATKTCAHCMRAIRKNIRATGRGEGE